MSFPTIAHCIKSYTMIRYNYLCINEVDMINEVVSVKMPVKEKIRILKNHFEPENATGREARLSLVTGIHGDELDGQYVCYEVIRQIKAHPELLTGTVDVYPCINPLGMDMGARGIPMFDLDMNRAFPGDNNGAMAEYVAAEVVNDIIGSDLCIDVHSSNVYIKEAPQVRLNEDCADKLLPYAKIMNADFVWVYSSITVREATLAYSLNKLGVPTLVTEMGVGLRINNAYCRQLIDGIFNIMIELGIWQGERPAVKEPIMSTEGQVDFIHAEHAGLFVSALGEQMGHIKKGERIGDIISPVDGEILQEIISPADGIVFSLRENPVIYKGTLLARVYAVR